MDRVLSVGRGVSCVEGLVPRVSRVFCLVPVPLPSFHFEVKVPRRMRLVGSLLSRFVEDRTRFGHVHDAVTFPPKLVLRKVRILMAEREIEPSKHTRARVFELAREQEKELRQGTNPGDSSSVPERRSTEGESRRMRAGDLGKESTGFHNDGKEYDPEPDETKLGESIDVTLTGDAGESFGLGSAADAIGQSDGVGVGVDVGTGNGGVRTGTRTGPPDKAVQDRKRRKGKEWRPSIIPEDPLGPLSPPEEWWEGQIPPRRSAEEGSGGEHRGLLEALRWLEVKVGGGLGWESAGVPVESEESTGSRLTLERWSHFLPADGDDPVNSSRDGGRDG